jgi:hypothetical protein
MEYYICSTEDITTRLTGYQACQIQNNMADTWDNSCWSLCVSVSQLSAHIVHEVGPQMHN